MLFPQVPPRSGARFADALGVFAYANDSHFALLLSDELIEEVVTVVASRAELSWVFDETDSALGRIVRLAQQSGGGLVVASTRVAVPPGFTTPARTAWRAAANKDRSNMRVVVTEDDVALHTKELVPRGVPWLKGEPILFVSPARFVAVAEKIRWRMRDV